MKYHTNILTSDEGQRKFTKYEKSEGQMGPNIAKNRDIDGISYVIYLSIYRYNAMFPSRTSLKAGVMAEVLILSVPCNTHTLTPSPLFHLLFSPITSLLVDSLPSYLIHTLYLLNHIPVLTSNCFQGSHLPTPPLFKLHFELKHSQYTYQHFHYSIYPTLSFHMRFQSNLSLLHIS